MSEGKRPGGLTALAVFNFVFGAIGLLAAFGLIMFLAILLGFIPESPTVQETKEHLEAAGIPALAAIIVLCFLTASLVILSGIGYLKQSRFLGRTVGNAYAITGIAYSILKAATLSPEIGGGFQLATIMGLVYPLLTLLLLNTAFKRDLVH